METFWDSTPWEVGQYIHAAVERQRLEHDRAAASAYLTAGWAASAFFGKLPPWRSVISSGDAPARDDEARQTREEQIAMIKALAGVHGIKHEA